MTIAGSDAAFDLGNLININETISEIGNVTASMLLDNLANGVPLSDLTTTIDGSFDDVSISEAIPQASLPFTTPITGLNVDAGQAGTITQVNPNLNFTYSGTITASLSNIQFHLEDTSTQAVLVPEPGSVTLLALGAVGMIGYCVRRRRRA